MSDTYYARLGVSPSATPDEIKRSYRQLARRFHPDVDPSPTAAAHFSKISEAYTTLSDPRARLSYNQMVLRHRTGSTAEAPTELSHQEIWAAWERVLAYGLTGAVAFASALGVARWLGGDPRPWQLQSLAPLAGLGALLGGWWGVEANFVIGDFISRAWLWFVRLLRLIIWPAGLTVIGQQLIEAVELGHGPLAQTIKHDLIIGLAVVGLTIALSSSLKDH